MFMSDIPELTAVAVPDRDAMFAVDVVQFLNNKAANLTFHVNGTPVGGGYVDVDIDVSITHPFSNMPQYDGYDVRGIFIGSGSKTLSYNGKLRYASHGLTAGPDQEMHDFGRSQATRIRARSGGRMVIRDGLIRRSLRRREFSDTRQGCSPI